MAIYRKHSIYYIDYYLDGKRVRESAGPSKDVARDLLNKRLVERAEGKKLPERVAARKTFGQLSEFYMSVHGRYARSSCWRYMLPSINEVFGKMKISEIHPGDVGRFCNEIATRTSNSTSNRYLSLMKAVLNKAYELGELRGENPCARIKKKRENPARLRYLTHQQIGALLRCSHPRLRPIIVAALLTGMRRGEILNLTWENINFERGALYIPKTKSGKPREIPLPDKLRATLLDLGRNETGLVFDLPLISLRRYYNKALKNAEIPHQGSERFRWHDLRHTMASHYIMMTRDLPALQAILGHSTPAMTMRYAHLGQSHLKANMKAFESAMPMEDSKPAHARHPDRHLALATQHPGR